MSRLSNKIVSIRGTESFCWGILLCFRRFRLSKIFTHERGLSRVSPENLLSHSTKKLRTFSVSEKVWYRKMLWIGEGGEEGGSITFFCQSFVSQGAEKIGRGTLLCFGFFLLSKNVRDQRGGGNHTFLSELFFVTVPKHFVEEPLCVSQNV